MLEIIIDKYIHHLENLLKDHKTKSETWNKIKTNTKLLEYCTKINNNNFKSNIIIEKILNDTTMYKTTIYNKIINLILSNELLARIKNNNDTFLYLTLKNDNIKLTKEQKLFLIDETEQLPYSKNYYESKNKNSIKHGINIYNDIRYLILKNKNFSLQERKNLFNFFYPDEEIKIVIFEQLKFDIAAYLSLPITEDTSDYILNIKLSEYKDKKIKEIDNIKNIIELCKYIKTTISEETIKDYKRL